MGYQKRRTEYYKVKGTIGTNPPLEDASILSSDELVRRGLTRHRVVELQGVALKPVGDIQVHSAKLFCNITPEIEREQDAQLSKQFAERQRAYEAARGIPSECATLFKSAMEDWNVLLQRYSNSDASLDSTFSGFLMDHLRAEFDIVENHLAALFEPLKPAIVKLTGFSATNLQKFVNSLSVYSIPYFATNAFYSDAHNDIEMLIHKLKDWEEGERKAKEDAEKKHGFTGVRHQLNEAIVKEGVNSFVKWFYAGIGGLIALAGVAIWHFLLSKLFK